MLLSVVIPFYHVEKYIGDCLSLAAQLPPEDCEILLVDDCGSDSSLEISEGFCTRHTNMRIIHREKNGGLSAARNTGLAKAQGEYIYFLDSDDLPEPEALMAVARAAQALQLDVGKARFVYFDDETGKETPGPAIPQTDVMPGGALFAAQCRAELYEPMVWQCVYRRAFLEENRLTMADGLLFEDELFQAPALLYAQRTAAFETVILRYRQREGSIMRSFARSARWCESYLEACRRLSALKDECPQGESRAALAQRVGQIALSVVKNIAAYRLPEPVAGEALSFAKTHKKELSGYALASGDVPVMAQGALMALSVRAFLMVYARLYKHL